MEAEEDEGGEDDEGCVEGGGDEVGEDVLFAKRDECDGDSKSDGVSEAGVDGSDDGSVVISGEEFCEDDSVEGVDESDGYVVSEDEGEGEL